MNTHKPEHAIEDGKMGVFCFPLISKHVPSRTYVNTLRGKVYRRRGDYGSPWDSSVGREKTITKQFKEEV